MKNNWKPKSKKKEINTNPLLYLSEQLLTNYFEEENLPSIDRWLSSEMRGNKTFRQYDRNHLAQILFSAVRFGYFIAFLKHADPGGTVEGKTEDLFGPAFESYKTLCSGPAEVFSEWKKIHPSKFISTAGRRFEQSHSPSFKWPAVKGGKNRLNRVFDLFMEYKRVHSSMSIELLWQSIPFFYEEYLNRRIETSGWTREEFAIFLNRQESRPPLWIRFNKPGEIENTIQDFKKHSLAAFQDGEACRVRGSKGLYELDSFKNGVFEIQDLASQAISGCVQPKTGEYVWDCCAGRGGKTFHIAAGMKNKGAIHASDIRGFKLQGLRQRAAKAGFDNVRTFEWDGDCAPDLPLEVKKKNGFHWVLVDAPCSAAGTWRRNPDAKYRTTPESIKDLTSLQLKLLTSAAGAVRPGGHIVYATCSWLVDENEDIAEAFLKNNPEFRLAEQRLHGNPDMDSDTAFTAVFKKETH